MMLKNLKIETIGKVKGKNMKKESKNNLSRKYILITKYCNKYLRYNINIIDWTFDFNKDYLILVVYVKSKSNIKLSKVFDTKSIIGMPYWYIDEYISKVIDELNEAIDIVGGM